MKITRQLIGRAVAGLFILLIIAGIILYFNLNNIVRKTIEIQSTQSLDLQTTLGSARLALFGGSLSLGDLQIASPKGFDAPKMLTLAGGAVTVDYGQLRQNPVHIQTIVLDKPRVVIEQAGGKFNFQVLSDQQPKSESQMKVIIDKLTVKDAQVVLRPGLPGLDKEIVVPVPTLELDRIGTGDGNKNGVAIKEVALQVIVSLAGKANAANLPKELQAALQKNAQAVAKQLGGQVQKQLEQLAPVLKGTDIGDKVNKELGNQIGNLLGGDKKKEQKK